MSEIIVYGIPGSPFMRSVIAALEEKRAPWRLARIAPGEHKSPAYLARNAFGRVPVIEHDGFTLYETQAILRYIDATWPAPSLQPTDPRAIGLMNQLVGINDWYLFQQVNRVIGFEQIIKPLLMGGTPDLDAVAAAVPDGRRCFDEIERLTRGKPFLAGDALTIADLLIAPQIAMLATTPEGQGFLKGKSLAGWLARMEARPSFQATRTEQLMQAA